MRFVERKINCLLLCGTLGEIYVREIMLQEICNHTYVFLNIIRIKVFKYNDDENLM